ncbi:MAG: 50S ribosomal protein L18 [Candidatus Aminicenantales bacterium]|jgi:large subunit ribosomal protein L18
MKTKEEAKIRIRRRIRKTVRGTAERPRVFVFKSNRYIYTQAVNDDDGRVLASACTLEKAFKEAEKNLKNIQSCEKLGEILAQRLKEKKIEKIVFDRGIYPYHGRIKALAEAMRKGGLVF